MRWFRRLRRERLPAGFAGQLDSGEHVVAAARAEAGPVVATSHGLWVPEADGARRIGWHHVAKAVWGDGVLAVVEARTVREAGAAVVIADRPAARFRLSSPGALPAAVRARVDSSIRSRYRKDLPGGGAWFVRRAVVGAEHDLLQVRADPGTDLDVVCAIAEEAAERLRR